MKILRFIIIAIFIVPLSSHFFGTISRAIVPLEIEGGTPTNQGINLDIISKIESNNNTSAYNKRSGAIGLFQITPICLKHYNQVHNTKYTTKELYDPFFNRKVATWYFKWLQKDLQLDDESALIAYNWGIGNLRKWEKTRDFRKLPTETRNYLNKYKRLSNGQA